MCLDFGYSRSSLLRCNVVIGQLLKMVHIFRPLVFTFVSWLTCGTFHSCQGQTSDICHLQNCELSNKQASFVGSFCREENGYHVGPCCLIGTSVLGIDLGGCNVTNLNFGSLDFSRIQIINLEGVNVSCSLEEFGKFVTPKRIYLPGYCTDCPTGYEATLENGHVICSTVDYSAATCNATCPEHSECKLNSTGNEHCVCSDGYYGYKCLKKVGFPIVAYFSSLGVVTICVSAGLWATQRRKVIHHQD